MSLQSTKLTPPPASDRHWLDWAAQLVAGQRLMTLDRAVARCPNWRLVRLYQLITLRHSAYQTLAICKHSPAFREDTRAYDA